MAEPMIGGLRLPSAIAAALDEMCQDLDRFQARQAERTVLDHSITTADELVEELQGISLAGWAVVPANWQPRLDRFVGKLPSGIGADLRSGGAPCRLLDQVLEIEERLFRLKLGEWARAFEQPLRS